jgi:hypothetical protein
MDWSIKRLTEELKKHDPNLYALKTNSGMRQVWRKAEKWDAAYSGTEEEAPSSSPTQFILALTEDWTLKGKAVEWGIEPVMHKILEMDSWRDDSILFNLRRERERQKELRDRERKNEMKARAYDMRRDFAKATNEINTSTLEKVDHRRNYDGNR